MTCTIALVGNPNCGKTSLFNALTGLHQRVGNWAGVTVEKKTGHYQDESGRVNVVDLPGIYDLNSSAEAALDEQISAQFLAQKSVDVIVNIVDATQLERHLYLTTQLMELGIPVVLVLNMMDLTERHGIYIDSNALSEAMGCLVVPTSLRRKKGLGDLKKAIRAVAGTLFAPNHPDVDRDLNRAPKKLTAQEEEAFFRHAYVRAWLASCYKLGPRRAWLTQALDRIALNRFLGLPFFLFVMYLMFEFSITLGGALQPLFKNGSQTLFIDGVAYLGQQLGWPTFLTALLSQGIGLGLNTVLTFIPQIGALFLFLSFLEDSGYMARAAFVMDRVMQWVGLPGKSFVPLMIGFGCNVPAILATRTLESKRDRLMTILMAPFMSCGARLAIFAVFASAFFPKGGAWVVFLLYVLGIVIALATGWLIEKTLLKGQSVPFMIELPNYHLPQWSVMLKTTWQRLKGFLLRAGALIIPICVLVGSLNSIEPDGHFVPAGSSHSILSRAGQWVTPVFNPIGIDDQNWPATVGLLTGTLAKEVVVGTLNTLYTQSQAGVASTSFDLKAGLLDAWHQTIDGLIHIPISSLTNPFLANEADHDMSSSSMGTMVQRFGSALSAFAFMVFVLLYVPCVSTVAVTTREAGRWWAWFAVFWSISIAYVAAVITYQGVTAFLHPNFASLGWIVGCGLYLAFILMGLKFLAKRIKFKKRPVTAQDLGCTACNDVCQK